MKCFFLLPVTGIASNPSDRGATPSGLRSPIAGGEGAALKT